MGEIAVYIHIPFCKQKCSYCDFTSYSWNSSKATCYLNALKKEIKLYSSVLESLKVKTVYFGGGTPSILKGKDIAGLLDALFESFDFYSNPEITLEANPESVEKKKAITWKRAGVNRVSLGVQSFDEETLVLLSRKHDVQRARRAYLLLREVGFTNINLDFIFGVWEGEKIEFTLEEAVRLEPNHISAYALSLKEDTPLFKKVRFGEVKLPGEDYQADKFEFISHYLEEHGYRHYEISNFAQVGFECLHNLFYWRNENYLGLGVSAHSHLEGRRFANEANLEEYVSLLEEGKFPVSYEERLSEREEIKEKIIMGLRLSEGLLQKQLEALGGEAEPFLRKIDELKKKGLIEKRKGRIFIPQKYFFISNYILRQIV